MLYMSSKNYSANSPSGNPGMGSSSSSVFQQIFISIIVLSSIFVVICVVRWILLRVTTRRDDSSLLGKRNTGGLDAAAIAALPTFPYKKYGDNKVDTDEENNVSSMECSICLSAVEEGEMVKLLPICMHSFHGDCVGLWLNGHSTCPVCRIEVNVLASSSVVQCQVDPVAVPVLDIERQP